MNENLDTMKDTIFQKDILEELFKKYNSKNTPCNITTFIKDKYGTKPNVIANMKVKVSRLINKKPDAAHNFGMLELSNDLATYFNGLRTNGDPYLSMTHFLGKTTWIRCIGAATTNGTIRRFPGKDWLFKTDAKYKNHVCIWHSLYNNAEVRFLKKSDWYTHNTKLGVCVIEEKKSKKLYQGWLQAKDNGRFDVIDKSVLTGKDVGEIAKDVDMAICYSIDGVIPASDKDFKRK